MRYALDDTITSVLPASAPGRFADAEQITIRMLLNHTSGLSEYSTPAVDGIVLTDPERVWTVDEFLDIAAEQPPTGAPGAAFAYSNTNYNLLGLVIEEVTGAPWRTAVRERIVDRLGLEHTSLPEPGDASIGSNRAHGYELVDGTFVDVTTVDPSMADAAGGNALQTTTEDLSHFLSSLLAGQLFEHPSTLTEMTTFVPASGSPGQVGYGLGLEQYELPGGVEIIGHVGGTAGYLSFVGYLPEQQAAISMVINARDDPLPVIMPAVELLVAEAGE